MKKHKKRHHVRKNQSNKDNNNLQRSFDSDGASASTNIEAVKNERIRIYAVYTVLAMGIILGFVLAVLNITDSSFSFDFKSVQLRATLVGIVIMIFCVWGIFKFDSKVSIKNEKNE